MSIKNLLENQINELNNQLEKIKEIEADGYPVSVDDFNNDNEAFIPTDMKLLIRLLQISNVYNQGWRPDHRVSNTQRFTGPEMADYYVVRFYQGDIDIIQSNVYGLFTFKYKSAAEKFVTVFKKELLTIQKYI